MISPISAEPLGLYPHLKIHNPLAASTSPGSPRPQQGCSLEHSPPFFKGTSWLEIIVKYPWRVLLGWPIALSSVSPKYFNDIHLPSAFHWMTSNWGSPLWVQRGRGERPNRLRHVHRQLQRNSGREQRICIHWCAQVGGIGPYGPVAPKERRYFRSCRMLSKKAQQVRLSWVGDNLARWSPYCFQLSSEASYTHSLTLCLRPVQGGIPLDWWRSRKDAAKSKIKYMHWSIIPMHYIYFAWSSFPIKLERAKSVCVIWLLNQSANSTQRLSNLGEFWE